MTSPYLIKNLENPMIKYYVQSGYQAFSDLCEMYGFRQPDYITWISKLNADRQDVIKFYERLDKFQANPFKKPHQSGI